MVSKNNVQIESATSPTLTNRKNKLTQCFDDILKLSTEMLVQEQLKMVQLDPTVVNGFTANQKQLLRDRIHSFHGILDDLDITLTRCTEYIETVSKIGLEKERARQEELRRLEEEEQRRREQEEAEAQLRRQRELAELEEQKRKRERQQELEEQEAKARAKAEAEVIKAKLKTEGETSNTGNTMGIVPSDSTTNLLDDIKLDYGNGSNDPNSIVDNNNKLLYSFDDQNMAMDTVSTNGPRPETSNFINIASPTQEQQSLSQREGQPTVATASATATGMGSSGNMFGNLDSMEMSLFTDLDDPTNLRTGNANDAFGPPATNQIDLVDTNFGAGFGNDMLGNDALNGLDGTVGGSGVVESNNGDGDRGVLNDQGMADPLGLGNPLNGNDNNNNNSNSNNNINGNATSIAGNAMDGLNDPLQDPGDEYLTLNDFNDLNIDWNAPANNGDLDLNRFNI